MLKKIFPFSYKNRPGELPGIFKYLRIFSESSSRRTLDTTGGAEQHRLAGYISLSSRFFRNARHLLGSLYGERLVFPEGKKGITVKHQSEHWEFRDGNALMCISDYCTSSAVHCVVLLFSLFCILLFPLGNHNEAKPQHLLSNTFFIFLNFHLISSLLFMQCFTALFCVFQF